MGFLRSLGVGALLAGAAAAYLVQRRVQEDGITYPEAIRQLPAQVRTLWAETRQRALLAIDDGRQAAHDREQRVLRELAAAGPSSSDR
jgi:hypothetical protein